MSKLANFSLLRAEIRINADADPVNGRLHVINYPAPGDFLVLLILLWQLKLQLLIFLM